MKVFIKYSSKPPYLPEAIADSKGELAEILGVDRNVVYSSYSHHRSTYAEIEIGDTETQEGNHEKKQNNSKPCGKSVISAPR